MARLIRTNGATRCTAECSCGRRFVTDLDEDGMPGEDTCGECEADDE